MKKWTLLLCIWANLVFAGEIYQFKLEKSEKLQGTYTAELANGNTIHFAIVRNSDAKNFQLKPFLVDASKRVKPMDLFAAKEMFNIASYHVNNNILSIVNYDVDNKQLQIIDYDLMTGKNEASVQEMKTNPDNCFRLKDKTVLVFFDKKNNAVNVKTIFDQHHIEQAQINIPKEKVKLFRSLIDETPESVNQQEFVEKGSIAKRKGYLSGNHLTYTLEKDKNELQVFDFDLRRTDDFVHSTILNGFGKESKDVSNYYYDNKIVFLAVDKSDLQMRIFNAANEREIRSLSLGKDLKDLSADNQISEYIKAALKSTIKSTVTVNQTKNNKLIVHLDNVIEANYRYNYNWFDMHWFFMQQQMMWQQQQFIQQAAMRSATMGHPSPEGYFEVMPEEKKLASIEFVLDANFAMTAQENPETLYPKIDKDKYVDKYKEDKQMKNFSFGFTDNEVRFISMNPKTKTVSISFDPL
jgi:hypothetical protein